MPDVILNLLPVREEEKAAFEAAAPDAVHLYAGRRTATPEQFAQATIVMGWPRAEMLAQAPRLRWFHCMWAGTDQYTDAVPPSALMTSSAGTNSQSVAEHMLASLLSLYRKIPQCRDQQRDHAWIDVGDMKSLAGATVLVAGAGHVGSAFAQLCKALGAARTIGLKRTVGGPVPGFDEVFPMERTDELLPQADDLFIYVDQILPAFHGAFLIPEHKLIISQRLDLQIIIKPHQTGNFTVRRSS